MPGTPGYSDEFLAVCRLAIGYVIFDTKLCHVAQLSSDFWDKGKYSRFKDRSCKGNI